MVSRRSILKLFGGAALAPAVMQAEPGGTGGQRIVTEEGSAVLVDSRAAFLKAFGEEVIEAYSMLDSMHYDRG